MNATLLTRLAAELRASMRWHYLDEPSWFSPVLSIPFDRGRNHLVFVLESPGPFCFVRDESPFAGAVAPPRFARLAGAQVEDVSLDAGDRVLRLEVVTRGDGERLNLVVALFGSMGSASLRRGEAVLETTTPRRARETGERSAHDDEAHAKTPARARRVEPVGAVSGPFVLIGKGSLGSASPHPVGTPAGEGAIAGPFDDANSACAHIGALVLDQAQAQILHRIARPARRKADTLRRLVTNLDADLVRAADHPDERREAEVLAAYQSRIPAGVESVELPDLYDPARTLRIALDPASPIHVQIEKRFRRATKLEKSVAHSTRRLELVRRELTDLEAALELLARARSFGDALKLYEVMRAKFGIALERTRRQSGPSPRKDAREKKTYRTFELDPRWFAIVGRSNHENDEITFHVAAPTDWWFHAQGVAGSHVVLKARGGNEGPPARIIEQAASIAAHYSKARHSSLVPVIYTLRRYVRKFRGAAPGEVTCERETMVMVPPALPATTSN